MGQGFGLKRAAMAALAMIGAATAGHAAPAQPSCDTPPPEVRTYLADHHGLSVVTLGDLNADDLKLWLDAKHGGCPGLAAVDLDGSAKPAFAMALLQRGASGQFEQLVVLRRVGAGMKAEVLEPSFSAGNPVVVWRGPPGRFPVGDGSRSVTIPHDSIVFEQIESGSMSYYWSGGRFRHITTGD